MKRHRVVDGYCFDCGGGCILELAEENERRMRLGPPSKLTPHLWDEWALAPMQVIDTDGDIAQGETLR